MHSSSSAAASASAAATILLLHITVMPPPRLLLLLIVVMVVVGSSHGGGSIATAMIGMVILLMVMEVEAPLVEMVIEGAWWASSSSRIRVTTRSGMVHEMVMVVHEMVTRIVVAMAVIQHVISHEHPRR